MSAFDYDLFVIGGGSGGVRAARIAASLGARVALAEEHRIGGTCVIRGCGPKKLMVMASRLASEFDDAKGFGWTMPGATFHWPTLIDGVGHEVASLEGLYRKGLQANGVTVLDDRAVLENAGQVRLEREGTRLSCKNILVAARGTPARSNSIGTLPLLPNATAGKGAVKNQHALETTMDHQPNE